ncbi:MAG: hypothetical protein IKG83_01455, partial [Prevotella sp.]|nr:hypothetical protein [Prevotella sp.]
LGVSQRRLSENKTKESFSFFVEREYLGHQPKTIKREQSKKKLILFVLFRKGNGFFFKRSSQLKINDYICSPNDRNKAYGYEKLIVCCGCPDFDGSMFG